MILVTEQCLWTECLAIPARPTQSEPGARGPVDPPAIYTTWAEVVSSNSFILTQLPSSSTSASATIGRPRRRTRKHLALGLDGHTSYSASFDAGPPALPEWGNSEGQELTF
jgi:hypothetical protein